MKPQELNGQVQAAAEARSAEELFPQIHEDLNEVEARLRQVVHSRMPLVPEVYLHTVHAGGKRVRPALALMASRATGTVTPASFDVAVAVELIHLASLIHDDVIDDGGRRRARLTANRIWGNKSAVLVADYIHSLAYRLLCERCPIQAIERLSETVVQMCEGELSQMFNEGSLEVDEPLYYEMIGDKTASLMQLSCELGSMVAGGSPEATTQLAEYGRKIGLAFQIVDDLLDLTGDEERIGKPVGNDIRCGRLTLPLIHTLQNGNAVAREELLPLICRDGLDVPRIQAIREVLQRAGALRYAADCARRLAEDARAHLAVLPEGEPRAALEALAFYIVARTL